MTDTVFINGAAGFLGGFIVEAFGKRGYNLRVSDVDGADFSIAQKYDAEILPGDIHDTDLLRTQVAGVDAVIHVAGLFDYGLPYEVLERVNHQGVHNICRAVLDVNPHLKRFVQISSVGCYGKPRTNPVHEDDPKRPRNNYEKTKWLGEQAAFTYYREHGLPVTAICPSLVYGPRSRYGYAMYLGLFACMKENGREILRGPQAGRLVHGVHVEDVANAVVLLTEDDRAIGRRFNCADRSPVPNSTVWRILAEGVGMEYRAFFPEAAAVAYPAYRLIEKLPFNIVAPWNARWAAIWKTMQAQYGLAAALQPRFDRDWFGYFQNDHVYDYTRLLNLGFEWTHPDFETAMTETIQWYKDNEWLP